MHSFKARSDLLISAPSIPVRKQKRFSLINVMNIQESLVKHCALSNFILHIPLGIPERESGIQQEETASHVGT
jgi:hypothetical protein